MKTRLLILFLCAASLAAFAQGKVSLQNDGGSLVTLFFVEAADAGVRGQAVSTTGPLPSGVVLDIGLFGGTSSSTMTLQYSEPINPVGGTGQPAGIFTAVHFITTFPGGTADFFRLFMWDSAYPTPFSAEAAGSYFGDDNIFTMTPGTSIVYPSITSGGGSTWAAVGNENPWPFTPEPSTLALAGLGAAALLIFGRRKSASEQQRP